MYINHEKKFIFVHIPKTAGSSIHIFFKDFFNILDRSDPLPEIHHKSFSSILNEDYSYRNYFKFAVIRNPYDRFLSAYRDFSQNKYYSRLNHPYQVEDGCTFDQFCFDFPNSIWAKDIHFTPQHNFLTINGKIVADQILRYENLRSDLEKLFKDLDLPINVFDRLPKHRKTRKEHEFYTSAYNNSTKDIIGSFFKKDLTMFNYDF